MNEMSNFPKKRLDHLIQLTRDYWNTGDRKILGERLDAAEGFPVGWSAMIYLLEAILGCDGFDRGARNEVIYDTIRTLGWEVVDDEEHTPE